MGFSFVIRAQFVLGCAAVIFKCGRIHHVISSLYKVGSTDMYVFELKGH